MIQNDLLRTEVFPSIYSGYPTLLNAIYSANRVQTIEQKRDFLEKLQKPARELTSEYQKETISVDYLRTDYQSIYLLRYFIQYALIIPSILYYHLKDFCHFENNLLTSSFFRCGPGSEIYGLMHYVKKIYPNTAKISAAMLDKTSTSWTQSLYSYPDVVFTGWKYSRHIVFDHFLSEAQNPSLYAIADFKSDIDRDITDLLSPTSSRWITESDLICFQFCLNEVSTSRHQQLMINLKHIVNIMKPGALMLIIEPPYKRVEKLLESLRYELATFNNNIEIRHKPNNDSSHIQMPLDLNYVPPELETYLFLKEHKTLLATSIKYRWLALSKR